MLSRPQVQIIDVKSENRNKSTILNFFSAIFEFVREPVISNMNNKFGKATWQTFQVIVPTSKCYRRRDRTSIAIAHLFKKN